MTLSLLFEWLMPIPFLMNEERVGAQRGAYFLFLSLSCRGLYYFDLLPLLSVDLIALLVGMMSTPFSTKLRVIYICNFSECTDAYFVFLQYFSSCFFLLRLRCRVL